MKQNSVNRKSLEVCTDNKCETKKLGIFVFTPLTKKDLCNHLNKSYFFSDFGLISPDNLLCHCKKTKQKNVCSSANILLHCLMKANFTCLMLFQTLLGTCVWSG